MRNLSTLLLALVLLSCGTKKTESSSSEATPVKQENAMVLSNVQIQIPDGWQQEQPDSKMRVAQLSKIDNVEHKLAVFYFGQQDMVEANLSRWRGQFSEISKEEQPEVTSENITTLKLSGTFKKKPFPMSQEFVETPDYGMLAAIIPSNEGPYYLKITGPIAFISDIESDFIEMLNSVQN